MEKTKDPHSAAQGIATVLAIGTANPPNCIHQHEYPDYYFRVTNSDHMSELKEKFKSMCLKSTIKKRYFCLNEDILNKNPNIASYDAPSLDARQEILETEIPKLGMEAAVKAIKEWGQPKSLITHLIFCSTAGVDMPGADYELVKLLGLNLSVKRVMLYFQGCYIGGTALRLAKDFAENNSGSRILIVSCEINSLGTFRGPSSSAGLGCLAGQVIFGDGAAALIVGANNTKLLENPLFQIVSAAQTIIPNSDGSLEGHVRETGLTIHLKKDTPTLIAGHIESCLDEAFGPFGIKDWNSLFWVVQVGMAALLDQIEAKVGLRNDKLSDSRSVLSEYGNMVGASVYFVLNEMREKSIKEKKTTTGRGLEWGVLFGLGPGLTVDTIVLRSFPIGLN